MKKLIGELLIDAYSMVFPHRAVIIFAHEPTEGDTISVGRMVAAFKPKPAPNITSDSRMPDWGRSAAKAIMPEETQLPQFCKHK